MILFLNNFCEDDEMFDRIYNTYYNYAYKICYNIFRRYDILQDDKQMDDTLQEAFQKIYKIIGKIKNVESAKPLISAIVRNTAINSAKKIRNTKNKNIMDIDDDVLVNTIADSSNDPLTIIVVDESVELIYQEILKLDQKYSDVLLLKVKFECEIEEIAQLLNIPLKTAYTRYERGKIKLKKKLLELQEGGIVNEK